MKVKYWIKYDEEYIPPRCRLPRYKRVEEYVNINLTEITIEKAQLAFEDNSFDGKGKIYFYRKKLWSKAKITDVCAPSDSDKYKSPLEAYLYWQEHSSWFFPRDWRDGEHPTREHMVKMVKESVKNWLVIDGELYKQTTEPRYEIVTFGLGHNHGSTGLFCSYGYNENISRDNYFSALQGEQAVAYAKMVAERRGDTDSIPRFKPFIVCHMPELVKINPQKQHGNGNPFLAEMERMVECSDDPLSAGTLIMLAAHAMNESK